MRAAWWWIDRWRKSTAYTDMTFAQQGAYRNLLDELWLRDGLLPLDDRILGKIAGDIHEWPGVRDVVLARFVRTPQGYRNQTHDEIAKESARRAAKQQRYRDRLKGVAAVTGNVTVTVAAHTNGRANNVTGNVTAAANTAVGDKPGNEAGNVPGNVTGSPSPSPSPSFKRSRSPDHSHDQNLGGSNPRSVPRVCDEKFGKTSEQSGQSSTVVGDQQQGDASRSHSKINGNGHRIEPRLRDAFTETWKHLRESGTLSKRQYHQYFNSARLVAASGSTLTVAVDSDHIAHFINKFYLSTLHGALLAVQPGLQVKFIVHDPREKARAH